MANTPSPVASLESHPAKEAIQDAVLETLLAMTNQFRFALTADSDAKLWGLLSTQGIDFPSAVGDPDLDAKALGLRFNDVEETCLAKTVMQMYDYAYLGLEDTSLPSLDNDEGEGAWISRLLFDLRRSEFLAEWDEYTAGRTRPAVEACLLVAEMANARLMLEGGQEGFYLHERDIGLLTFRQLSLLANMTEASLRTVVSRGTGLRTIKQGNSTFIEIHEAKAWLQERKRYLPIRRSSSAGALPLTDRRYATVDDLALAIDERLTYLAQTGSNQLLRAEIRNTLGRDLQPTANGGLSLEITADKLLHPTFTTTLARVLDVNSELFRLRAAETVYAENLRRIEQQIKEVAQ